MRELRVGEEGCVGSPPSQVVPKLRPRVVLPVSSVSLGIGIAGQFNISQHQQFKSLP